MTRPSALIPISYAGYRFPLEVISYAVWLYFRFPLSLRMVEEITYAHPAQIVHDGAETTSTMG